MLPVPTDFNTWVYCMQTRIVMSYCAKFTCTLFILFHKSTAVTCSVEASIVVLGYSKLAPVGEELTYKIMFLWFYNYHCHQRCSLQCSHLPNSQRPYQPSITPSMKYWSLPYVQYHQYTLTYHLHLPSLEHLQVPDSNSLWNLIESI